MKATNSSIILKLVFAIFICEAVGIISSLISQADLNFWFSTINKPSWNPPGYVFGPVWSILYLFMGIALWLVWKSNDPKKINASLVFALQLFFNFWWSILFFKFHSPELAMVDIVLMIISITTTIFLFAPISKAASWLLVPYIAWVSFASLLNYTILSMN